MRNIRLLKVPKFYLLIGFFLLLTACSKKPEFLQELSSYNLRLSGALEINIEPDNAAELKRPPEIRLSVASAKLSVIDFLRLYGCELQLVLGERNSLLGQVAGSSQSLLHLLAFLETAPACIEQLNLEQKFELSSQLEQAFQLKRRELPKMIFNAIFAGPEYRQFWSTAVPANYPDATNADVLVALSWLEVAAQRWMNGEYYWGTEELEHHLSILRAGDGGALLKSLVLSAEQLRLADRIMQRRLEGGKLCLSGVPTRRYRNFEGVIRRFFLMGVQPRQAALGRRYYELMAQVRGLERTLEAVLPQGYRDWIAWRDQALDKAVTLPAANVATIKLIAEQCGANFGGR